MAQDMHTDRSPSTSPMATIGQALVRGVVTGLLGALVMLLVDRLVPSEDANIGAGLLGIGTTLVIACSWGARDGLHERGGRPVLLWAAALAVASAVSATVTSGFSAAQDGVGIGELLATVGVAALAWLGALPLTLPPCLGAVALGQAVGRRR